MIFSDVKKISLPYGVIRILQLLLIVTFQLLLRATNVFRSEHFARQDKVQAEIAKRTRTLRALKTHQLKELESMSEMRKQLQEAAERLAERYEDIKDKQMQFTRRCNSFNIYRNI